MDITGKIKEWIIQNIGYAPTSGQKNIIDKFAGFIVYENNQSLFLLKGYAGTGKTTLVSALVKMLPRLKIKSVLLAPTGRAAKVLSSYSGRKAYTIHKKIYTLRQSADGNVNLQLQSNSHQNTFFIVDEASMIPDRSSGEQMSLFASRNILEDLVFYVENGDNCRLILIGDTAQLPPVRLDISPALDLRYLRATLGFELFHDELKEVVRQSLDSGILMNATVLRKKIAREDYNPPFFDVRDTGDIIRINGNELEDELNTSFGKDGFENTVIITRSNKRANLFNREIRYRILFRENEISGGDIMMSVRNNYYWLPDKSETGFIANGDLIEVMRIAKTEEMYGFHFADASIRLIDYPEEKELEVKLLLDTVMAETASLSRDDYYRLFEEVMKDYEDEPSRSSKLEKVKNNPYYNALQVKFAYALTCHKTQGGQWSTVFIDQGYLKEDMINKEYLRWLYTAITRATEKVYLVNFLDYFFV